MSYAKREGERVSPRRRGSLVIEAMKMESNVDASVDARDQEHRDPAWYAHRGGRSADRAGARAGGEDMSAGRGRRRSPSSSRCRPWRIRSCRGLEAGRDGGRRPHPGERLLATLPARHARASRLDRSRHRAPDALRVPRQGVPSGRAEHPDAVSPAHAPAPRRGRPGPLRFLAEIQDARTWSNSPRDFTGSEIDKIDVTQLLVAATARDVFGRGLRADLHLGRMTLDLGSRRLVARNSFRNTTNAFDGGHVQIGNGTDWRLRGFFVLPVALAEGYFDDDVTTRRLFWGVAAEVKRAALARGSTPTTSGSTIAWGSVTTRRSACAACAGRSPARSTTRLELIGQFGERGTRDQSAFATQAALGYTLDAPWKPRLLAQFDYASGTKNPNGDESHTFDRLFGARRFDLDPTGIFGAFQRSNILSPGIRLIVSPSRRCEAQVKVRHWQLVAKRDAFVGTGLREPAATRAGSSARTSS
ncbi:MAG: alginate export family protein [Chromatiales bacterium]|nr:alginate export family protein [Chromatiales bacterium]